MSTITKTLAAYLEAAAHSPLPEAVATKVSWHVLDTLAAGISGSRLAAGVRGRGFVTASGAAGPSVVWGDGALVDPRSAAFANGMSAHADETDDSHAGSIGHPGCAVVPAAFAVAATRTVSGTQLARAVAAGYDVGPRVMFALGRERFWGRPSNLSSHGYGAVFSAAAAAGVALGLPAERAEGLLSYTTQLASGVQTWLRDAAHVEKAFVFAGMPAGNGVYAAQLAEYGFEHVPDAFDGEPNFLSAVSDTVRPELAVDGLGSRFEIMATNIKKYAVGSPAQAAVQAAESLLARVPGLADRVTAVRITLPSNAAHVVDDRAMPDVNVQYLVAGTLLDGRFTFAMAHDPERMTGGAVRTLREATTLVPDDSTAGTRSATVEVTLSDGSAVSEHVPFVRGTTQDPMTWAEVAAKSTDLLEPVLGAARTRELIDRVTDLDSVQDIRSMAGLLHAG